MKCSVKAYAKINLLLDLTGKLPGGFHSIYTVMQSVGIFDVVTVETTGDGEIKLECETPGFPLNETNTEYKAAKAFFEYTGRERSGIVIKTEKTIPMQAGMAGGSADAAAVIAALDRLFDTKLSEDELLEIAEKVGMDVPFCLTGGTRLCVNKGEVMAKLPSLKGCTFVCVKPDQSISTTKAYAAFDEFEDVRHPDNEGFLYSVKSGDYEGMYRKAANVFEQVIEVRDRVRIKAAMRNHGARLSLMTGSGSAVFGLFECEENAAQCKKELESSFDEVYLCPPVDRALELI